MYTQEEFRSNDSGSYSESSTDTGLKKGTHMGEHVPINQPL